MIAFAGQYTCNIKDVREGVRAVPLLDKSGEHVFDKSSQTFATALVRVRFTQPGGSNTGKGHTVLGGSSILWSVEC